jgi:hypothetical protein
LPDSDQIPAKTIQGGETLWIKSTYSLILFWMRKNCLFKCRSILVHQLTWKAIQLTVVNTMGYQGKPGWHKIKWDTLAAGICCWCESTRW